MTRFVPIIAAAGVLLQQKPIVEFRFLNWPLTALAGLACIAVVPGVHCAPRGAGDSRELGNGKDRRRAAGFRLRRCRRSKGHVEFAYLLRSVGAKQTSPGQRPGNASHRRRFEP